LWITPNPYDYYLYGEALGGTGKKLRWKHLAHARPH
jgi:hypothetical protein